jgi:hypothetical protein
MEVILNIALTCTVMIGVLMGLDRIFGDTRELNCLPVSSEFNFVFVSAMVLSGVFWFVYVLMLIWI